MALGTVHDADGDGVEIAYTVIEAETRGVVDEAVVLVPGLMGHLEFNEEIPYCRALMQYACLNRLFETHPPLDELREL